MNATQMNYLFTLILIPECGKWVAQCLEYDIAAQGDTPKIAIDEWKTTLSGQIMLDLADGKEPLKGISKPPSIYHKLAEDYGRLMEEKEKYKRDPEIDMLSHNKQPLPLSLATESLPPAKLAFA